VSNGVSISCAQKKEPALKKRLPRYACADFFSGTEPRLQLFSEGRNTLYFAIVGKAKKLLSRNFF
jgi:hypothetical protein